jgi:hypothetical protein
MFVGHVETVQAPDCITVASTVRLQSIDSIGEPTFKVTLARTCWERCVVGGGSAASVDQLDGHMIKCASQIVNAIPKDRSPINGDWNETAIAVKFVFGVRIFLFDDAVWPERLESVDGGLKVRKVFSGPVNLYADTGQLVGHGETRLHEAPEISESGAPFSEHITAAS